MTSTKSFPNSRNRGLFYTWILRTLLFCSSILIILFILFCGAVYHVIQFGDLEISGSQKMVQWCEFLLGEADDYGGGRHGGTYYWFRFHLQIHRSETIDADSDSTAQEREHQGAKSPNNRARAD